MGDSKELIFEIKPELYEYAFSIPVYDFDPADSPGPKPSGGYVVRYSKVFLDAGQSLSRLQFEGSDSEEEEEEESESEPEHESKSSWPSLLDELKEEWALWRPFTNPSQMKLVTEQIPKDKTL